MSTTKMLTNTGKKRPPRAGMGRPKGAQNKITRTIRQAVEQAFHEVGGVEWLKNLAQSDPKAFAGLLSRLIPSDIKLEQPQVVYTLINALPDLDDEPEPLPPAPNP